MRPLWWIKNTCNDSYDNEEKDDEADLPCLGFCCVPDELFADGAEGRLREERGAELVTLDDVDFGLFDGASPLVEGEQTLSLRFRLLFSFSLTCGV